jgi:hypothetical protein
MWAETILCFDVTLGLSSDTSQMRGWLPWEGGLNFDERDLQPETKRR